MEGKLDKQFKEKLEKSVCFKMDAGSVTGLDRG